MLDTPAEWAYGGTGPPPYLGRAVTPVVTGDIRVRVVGEPREEVDVLSIAAALVDAALAIADRDDQLDSCAVAGLTDDDDREADDT